MYDTCAHASFAPLSCDFFFLARFFFALSKSVTSAWGKLYPVPAVVATEVKTNILISLASEASVFD